MATTTEAATTSATEAAKAAAGAAAHHGGGLPNPMHQFEIIRYVPFKLFGLDASFTNSALAMVMAAALIVAFIWYAMRNRSLIPSRVQSVAEMAYEFIAGMVRSAAGEAGMRFFPFVFSIFFFVLLANLIGFIPYSMAVTSHIVITAALGGVLVPTYAMPGVMQRISGFSPLNWGLNAYQDVLLRVLRQHDAVIGLRVSDENEVEGLDIALHEERGYNL